MSFVVFCSFVVVCGVLLWFVVFSVTLKNNAKNLDPSYKTDLDFEQSFCSTNS